MKVAIPRERRDGEPRVAATPETVKKLKDLGLDVAVESGAGEAAAITDADYETAGASVETDAKALYAGARIVLKVRRPTARGEGTPIEMNLIPKDAILIGLLEPHGAVKEAEGFAKAGINAFAMEFVPRITRAQTMDVLSSQSNLAGYRAVIDGAHEYGRAFPLMMTAAGRINPARVCVMGAGVAGLQAIATARRLGAVVSAFDVRPAVKEQVESLGAKFIEVDPEATKDAETAGGYAKEMGDDYKRKQAEVIHETLRKQDIVICTALIPGRPAPVLVTEEMVKDMPEGAVIVDLAVESGGNCPLSEPGAVVEAHGVKIVGHTNVPGRLSADASALYARNLFNFVSLMIEKDAEAPKVDFEDEIIKGTCLTWQGEVVHPSLVGSEGE